MYAWPVTGSGGIYFKVRECIADQHALLELRRQQGCSVDAKIEASEVGKSGGVMKPQGKRVELWEPAAR